MERPLEKFNIKRYRAGSPFILAETGGKERPDLMRAENRPQLSVAFIRFPGSVAQLLCVSLGGTPGGAHDDLDRRGA